MQRKREMMDDEIVIRERNIEMRERERERERISK